MGFLQGSFDLDLGANSRISHDTVKSTTPNSMDSPIISRLFRQLFTHRPCQSLLSRSRVPFRIEGRRSQARCLSGTARRKGDGTSASESHWQQRTSLFPMDMSEEYQKYPMVTSEQLRGRRERPRRVKMLTRDFIEGMLDCSEVH
jgi:hypothetical protein